MKIGLVGLAASGKTTLLNLLTHAHADTSRFGAGRTETNLGTARVPDKRIDWLSKVYKPRKTIYAQIEVTDLPGLQVGQEGSGGGNPFLAAVRNVDALVAVARAFSNPEVAHPLGEIDPLRDLETIHMELLFSDLGVVDKRLQRLAEGKKKKEHEREAAVLEKCRAVLEGEGRLSNLSLPPEELDLLRGFGFLTQKPMLVVLNLDDEAFRKGDYPGRERLTEYLKEKELPLIEVAARTEMEIEQLSPEDRAVFLEDLGIEETGISRLARAIYDHLGLISFFTVGEDEVRAWTIEKGTNARKAAGKIHSDIERGFIRAEVVRYADMEEWGSMAKVREKGLFRLEGKDYIVQDGDIINFRFNV